MPTNDKERFTLKGCIEKNWGSSCSNISLRQMSFPFLVHLPLSIWLCLQQEMLQIVASLKSKGKKK